MRRSYRSVVRTAERFGLAARGGTGRGRKWGAEQVVLFTDLANPVSMPSTSGSGSTPVSDWVTIALSAGDPGRVP